MLLTTDNNKDKIIKKIIKNKEEQKEQKEQINISDSESNHDQISESKVNNNPNATIILDIIKEKGGKVIDGVYITKNSLFTIECKNKHQWTTKATNIIHNMNWCFECSKVKAREKDKERSQTLKDWLNTTDGKENKKKAHEKRSETMQKEKEEFRKKIKEAGVKICQKCGGNPKPLNNFGEKSDSKDGYQSWCKKCILEYKHEKKLKK